MITGLGTHSSAGKDLLGNGTGMVRPFGLSRERHHVRMDPQNFGYLSFSPSFASCVFACRKKRARTRESKWRDRIVIRRKVRSALCGPD